MRGVCRFKDVGAPWSEGVPFYLFFKILNNLTHYLKTFVLMYFERSNLLNRSLFSVRPRRILPLKLTKSFLSLLVAQATSGFRIYTFVFPTLPIAINPFSSRHEIALNIVVLDFPVTSSKILCEAIMLLLLTSIFSMKNI
uniref:Replication protein n=1 Tax=Bacillus thuringiensis subsp. entomocidus TaxID=1436 RepID=Q8KSC5_BACTE|nr:replication protein [Bacillus thuringiensis serovar entomocidus]